MSNSTDQTSSPSQISPEADSQPSPSSIAECESSTTETNTNKRYDIKSKKPTVRTMFIERMKREGREPEWFATVKQLMAETGKGFWTVSWDAMRKMGYTTPAEEKRLNTEYLENLHLTSAEIATSKVKEEIKQERRTQNFE